MKQDMARHAKKSTSYMCFIEKNLIWLCVLNFDHRLPIVDFQNDIYVLLFKYCVHKMWISNAFVWIYFEYTWIVLAIFSLRKPACASACKPSSQSRRQKNTLKHIETHRGTWFYNTSYTKKKLSVFLRVLHYYIYYSAHICMALEMKQLRKIAHIWKYEKGFEKSWVRNRDFSTGRAQSLTVFNSVCFLMGFWKGRRKVCLNA